MEARLAHIQEVEGSNPSSAIRFLVTVVPNRPAQSRVVGSPYDGLCGCEESGNHHRYVQLAKRSVTSVETSAHETVILRAFFKISARCRKGKALGGEDTDKATNA